MASEENKPHIGEELRRMGTEPLLPIEKKLIAGSLILGLVLLAILVITGNASVSPWR
jgi:hypothetical protein